MVLYHNVMSELMEEDRQEAVAVIDDDVAFDRWLAKFDAKQKKNAAKRHGASGGQRRVDPDEYLAKYATVIGGEA